MDYMLSAEQAYKAFVIVPFTLDESITEALNFHGFVMNNQIIQQLTKLMSYVWWIEYTWPFPVSHGT